ncbi:MAG: hypothetical protein M1831_004943 [Alyxoria varia]|nr:MAG: hypothetical protein M1831_004943 [Alyxoria varia]
MDDAPDYEDGSDKENQTGQILLHEEDGAGSLPTDSNRKEKRPLHNPFVDDSSDESDTALRARPHGKIASSMLGSELDKDERDTNEKILDGTTSAYERVKNQLLGADASKDAVLKEPATQSVEGGIIGDEDKPDSAEDSYKRIRKQLLGGELRGDFEDGRSNDISHLDLGEPTLERQNPQSDIESLESNNGLFVSPEKPTSRHISTSPLSEGRSAKSRLQELVARKRKARVEREKAAGRVLTDDESANEPASSSEERLQARKTKKQVLLVDSEGDSDKETRNKLTQQARPTRKASKKAIEEMNRETQRMSRNMQLTHQAKTKTKHSTADFFKKMNFRQSKHTETAVVQPEPSSSISRPPSSDVERRFSTGTPPSSPPSVGHALTKLPEAPLLGSSERPKVVPSDHSDGEIPTIEEFLARPCLTNAVKHPAKHAPSNSPMGNETRSEKPSLRKFAKSAKQTEATEDADDDLEITSTKKPSRIKTLDSVPAQKASNSRAIDALRALAHLNGDTRGYEMPRGSMTATELKQSLQKRARAQAHVGRMEKIQALRDKGVVVSTEEEKEKDQMQLENMLDNARQEAEKLAKREKEAAKKDDSESKVAGNLPDSEDEDADWQESEDGGDMEFSGSDDEREEDGEEDDEKSGLNAHASILPQDETAPENSLIDDEAGEDEDEPEESAEGSDGDNEESEDDTAPVGPVRTRKRKAVIDSEDEEDGKKDTTTAGTAPTTPAAKSAAADAFGFAQAKPARLGLSQVFAGTMAQTQTQGDAEGSLADTQDLPAMPSPIAVPSTLVQDSETNELCDNRSKTTTPAPSRFSVDAQTPMLGMQTQTSDLVDPSQDVGFQTNYSPAKMGPVLQKPTDDYSTVETVMLPRDSPADPKKRRLLRPPKPAESFTGEAPQTLVNGSEDEAGDDGNAFQIMRRAAKEPAKPAEYNKKISEAKGMVEEQAEESEDEYAGLGGASDDDSQGEVDEEMKKMINDENPESLKERKLAAYHANKERVDDEKLLERLYKDINNGGFRRKRGADMDLLESDDEEEAASRRRAAKQREFAKMRKALLADEKIGKIAENPKQQAFLQAIEDRADDDDLTFLDDADGEPSEVLASHSERDPSRSLAPTIANTKKRTHDEYSQDGEDCPKQPESRPPPFMRRTNTKEAKPAWLAQIRTTLSELIGDENREPEFIMDSQGARNEEHEDEQHNHAGENDMDQADDGQFTDSAAQDLEDSSPQPTPESSETANKAHAAPHPRRSAPQPASHRSSVIDRMALKRRSSTKDNTANTGALNATLGNSRLAFAAQPSKASASSFFKVPSLLRRATTNASTSSNGEPNSKWSGSGVNAGALKAGAAAAKEEVKMGGSKKSSVNYYVREQERTAKVKEVEKVREEGRKRDGELRRRENVRKGLGGLAGGQFG